jgi:hypothetical protein
MINIKARLNERQLETFMILCEMDPKDACMELNISIACLYERRRDLRLIFGTDHAGRWMKLAIEQGLVKLTNTV